MLDRLFDRWARWMARRGSWKMVRREGLPYLERFYLFYLGGYSLNLHCFHMSDPDPLHDHPWNWGRMILCGYYGETHQDGSFRYCIPGDVVWFRSAVALHRVILKPGTRVWTLFWHGPRRRAWGFLKLDGLYVAAKDTGDDSHQELRGVIFPRRGVDPMSLDCRPGGA